jgi:hypothetical protein
MAKKKKLKMTKAAKASRRAYRKAKAKKAGRKAGRKGKSRKGKSSKGGYGGIRIRVTMKSGSKTLGCYTKSVRKGRGKGKRLAGYCRTKK